MKVLISVLINAFRDVLKPKILSVIILPFLGSFIFWGTFTWAIWDWILSLGFKFYNLGIMQKLIEFLSPYFTLTEDPLVAVTAAAFIMIVILPAALITAMLITSVLLVPLLVSELRSTDFPTLIKKSNSIFAGTTTSLSYSMKYIFTWIGSLPLWVIIPAGPIIIPYLLLSWFNSRLFAWEVMIEVASPEETKIFMGQNSGSLFTLGLLTSVLYYIPVINLVASVIVSAAFARFCLTKFNENSSLKIG